MMNWNWFEYRITGGQFPTCRSWCRLYKPMTSGDMLYNTILKAMSVVPKDQKRFIA